MWNGFDKTSNQENNKTDEAKDSRKFLDTCHQTDPEN
jgi:hypothetical protein